MCYKLQHPSSRSLCKVTKLHMQTNCSNSFLPGKLLSSCIAAILCCLVWSVDSLYIHVRKHLGYLLGSKVTFYDILAIYISVDSLPCDKLRSTHAYQHSSWRTSLYTCRRNHLAKSFPTHSANHLINRSTHTYACGKISVRSTNTNGETFTYEDTNEHPSTPH